MGKHESLPELDDGAILDLKQQKRVLKAIALITLAVFIPLGIKNILIGQHLLAVSLLAFEASLLLEVSAMVYNRKRYFGVYPPLLLLIFSVVLAIRVFGTLATYWLFPIVIGVVFLLPRRDAILANFLMISGAGFAALMHQSSEISVRYVVALIITAMIVHIVVRSVRDLQVELRRLLVTDAMTGAYNRHQLQDSLVTARDMFHCSTVAIIDVDNFKHVNDTYGHDKGDRALVEVVEIIDQHTEPSELLFRLGGDEFLLLFQGKNLSTSYQSMQAITRAVRQLQDHHPFPLTISSGIAESVTHESTKQWLKRADQALYHAKQSGRDQVCSAISISETSEPDTKQRVIDTSKRL
ncbi:GGDEF domain-containing protein [Vibrio sp. JPW-9-11-11]|uniref:GGDEF domain-containing protein n=1 Tax=Vibrio sp. JPW-9-11-11 TaxID=1416532 RepID=UPI001593ED41|nr:GGDEF domain-containing protein [Vibrio sp. JPW-9-11-11]NVD08990.1 GGDEF domain-containing protein [Vibrio sp. JPW-9-11-11]